jgi:hypothetical protein
MSQVLAKTKPQSKRVLVYIQYQASVSRKIQGYSIISHTVPYLYEKLSAMEMFSEYPVQ